MLPQFRIVVDLFRSFRVLFEGLDCKSQLLVQLSPSPSSLVSWWGNVDGKNLKRSNSKKTSTKMLESAKFEKREINGEEI